MPSALTPLFAPDAEADDISKVLHAVRRHLGMDVAFVSEFREKDRIFRHVDAEEPSPLHAGDVLPLEAGYCRHVVEGRLPELIPDTDAHPLARALPATQALPIGSHVSVPIVLEDGRVYGTLCCFGFEADPTLTPRDLQMMRAFAELMADRIGSDLRRRQVVDAQAERIDRVIREDLLTIAYQPIIQVAGGETAGWECLSRFPLAPQRAPDLWFREALDIGWGPRLEGFAMRKALRALPQFPPGTFIAVNGSPALVMSDEFEHVFDGVALDRVVLEITEHEIVEDYAALIRALAPWRVRGLRLAIDDAGAGYASMRHTLNLQPDFIKLDMSLTRDIDHDPRRRALATALIAFANAIGSTITAEGVETAAELEQLRTLGATKVQGYFLGRPVSLEEALRSGRRAPVLGAQG
jgi:EAL domain-containing protein (putative c-di-GMP-specific phosphodiesterase class I)